MGLGVRGKNGIAARVVPMKAKDRFYGAGYEVKAAIREFEADRRQPELVVLRRLSVA